MPSTALSSPQRPPPLATRAMTNWRRKLDADDHAATVVVLSVNDVYDMHPDEHGRGGLAEFATLLERERAAVPADATLLVTLNGDFLSGSEIGERCKGCVCSSLVTVLRR